MLVSFDNISDNARIWVYQAGRKLNETEVAHVEETLTSFSSSWAAHGAQLQSSFRVFHNQFVILAVDEGFNAASGCSIDGSVHIMQELTKNLGVDFFDRTKIAFILDEEIQIESLSNVKAKIEEGQITADTRIFNNLVDTKKALESSWVVPAKDTWMSRYFQKSVHNI